MVDKDIHVKIEKELLKWLKIHCIKENNKLNPSKVINDLLVKFREENS